MGLFATLPLACTQTDSVGLNAGRPHRAAVTAPSLGTAGSFVVLGSSTVTNTGPTTVEGDLGVSPGLAVTGFPPGLVQGGTTHAGDASAASARADATTAYLALAGQPCGVDLTGQDLGGLTLVPGVYCFASSAQLTGTLVLNAEGDPAAVFVFKIGSSVTTASNAAVTFINGGQSCRTFWQVGSSATLGTGTAFAGNILALTSITLDTGAVVAGRVLARNGAVTLDDNQISAPACAAAVDAGMAPVDAGMTPVDAGSPGLDAGAPALDAGTPAVDAGTPAVDAGTPPVDAGLPAIDAGMTPFDAGTPAVDAGLPAEVDAGTPTFDAGTLAIDAGTPEVDGGTLACCLGKALCGTTCTWLGGDIANCGACGHACGSGEFCAGGTCLGCSPVCNGQCVYLQADHDNCGACNVVCGATEVCAQSACQPCAHICNGVCVDTMADDTNCGACGNSCAANERCSGGSCTACASTCGGYCTDLVNNALNCGACGNACPSGNLCVAGACVCPVCH